MNGSNKLHNILIVHILAETGSMVTLSISIPGWLHEAPKGNIPFYVLLHDATFVEG